ncbi:MAG: hypothetical protein LAT77_02815 [Aliidiomarina sp.]|uniref:hypothetical protein n=1 Tax=Aliidiomarina sp. TaxID=1872439 RepID=UPI0025C30C17|nr:hypothetical protein [Aliidiomarina sp.]MCH8500825.1 hypothetical protein [Aliidiomarina sp.]
MNISRLLVIVLFMSVLSGCVIQYNSGRYYTISTIVGGSGEITPRSATVAEGERLTMTLRPNSGWTIGNISGCDGQLDQLTYRTGRIRADCTVRVEFVEIVGVAYEARSWTESNGHTVTIIQPVSY